VGQAAAKPPQIHLVVMWALRAQLRLLEVWALLLMGDSSLMRAYLLIKIITLPVKQLCDLF
jgi:hypothetical protein